MIPEIRLCQWEVTGKMYEYNTNCDKACTDINLREEMRWKFCATNLTNDPSP
jgi:hypothetical protein